jgi:hypothetical protein
LPYFPHLVFNDIFIPSHMASISMAMACYILFYNKAEKVHVGFHFCMGSHAPMTIRVFFLTMIFNTEMLFNILL